eukprot:PhM_4_TR4535/c0_g1_i1/m.61946
MSKRSSLIVLLLLALLLTFCALSDARAHSRGARGRQQQQQPPKQPEKKQDHYKTLGVPRTASERDIKRAFKKLSWKWHPDKNKEPGARDRYQRINEAYTVLSDPEKRKDYDLLGDDFEQQRAQQQQQQQYGNPFGGGGGSYQSFSFGGHGGGPQGGGGFGGFENLFAGFGGGQPNGGHQQHQQQQQAKPKPKPKPAPILRPFKESEFDRLCRNTAKRDRKLCVVLMKPTFGSPAEEQQMKDVAQTFKKEAIFFVMDSPLNFAAKVKSLGGPQLGRGDTVILRQTSKGVVKALAVPKGHAGAAAAAGAKKGKPKVPSAASRVRSALETAVSGSAEWAILSSMP